MKLFARDNIIKTSHLHRLLYAATLFFACCIMVGIFFNMTQNTIVCPENDSFLFAFTILFAFCVAVLIAVLFGVIDRTRDSKQKIIMVILLLIYLLIMVVLMIHISERLHTDDLHNVDTAIYMLDHRLSDESPHIRYLKAYGNNYLLILITRTILKIGIFLHITNYVLLLTSLNTLMLLIGLFIAHSCVNSVWNNKVANKALLLMIMNPIYYFLGFWVYSASLCVPLMMAIIWLVVKLYVSSDHQIKGILYASLLGFIMPVGYYIRPVSIFPAIAFFLFLGIQIVQNQRGKNVYNLQQVRAWIIRLLFIIAAFVLTTSVITYEIDKCFNEQKQYNLPLSYWLNIGSQNNGDLAGDTLEDTIYVYEYENLATEDSKILYNEKTINNYRGLGLKGVLYLFYKKMIMTYSDAFPTIVERTFNGSYHGWICEVIKGPIMRMYSFCFFIIIYLGIILFCRNNFLKTTSLLSFILITTFLGAIVFYFFWEAKNDYSVPFHLVMIIMAAKSLENMPSNIIITTVARGITKRRLAIIALIITISLTNLGVIMLQKTEVTYPRVNGSYKSVCTGDELLFFSNDIEQSFVTSNGFNNITLQIAPIELKDLRDDKANKSFHYQVEIIDRNNNVIFYKEIQNRNLRDCSFESLKDGVIREITIKTDYISKGEYYLRIKKADDSKKDIYFVSCNNYCIDSYEGELMVEGGKYIDDLSMIVQLRLENEPYYPKKVVASIIIALLLLFGGAIVGLRIVIKHKYRTYEEG